MAKHILTINGGSSSIKFGLFDDGQPPERLLAGKIDRIGLANAELSVSGSDKPRESRQVHAPTQTAATTELMNWLEQRAGLNALAAVGHRIVHGGPHYSAPELVRPELLEELRRISPYDPEHMPAEIELIEAFGRHHPHLPQIACFDTAFHGSLPRVASLLAIPRRYHAMGVRRYGFHGLSYSFLMEELARVAGARAARGRVILAHLGNGASLAAVRDGHSIDTTMAFTPTAGLPMSTRSGDIDPGLVWYLARTEHMSAEQFHDMVNRHSGLLGISETASVMRDLLARRASDLRAADAVDLFCYQAKKWIGSFAAGLGGLDTLVFSGGIGENAPEVRAGICDGLDFLGIHLDKDRNDGSEAIISSEGSPVTVHVMRTDEEIVIAKAVIRVLAGGPNRARNRNTEDAEEDREEE